MKTKLIIAAILAAPIMAFAVDVIDYAPATVFAPIGFDSNDNAQLILDGTFPNTCYKVGEANVKVDKTHMRIEVRDTALHYKGGVCLYMLVPYFKTVNLGVLSEGKYELVVMAKDGTATRAGSMDVSKATTTEPDDYLYAPVEEATMDQAGTEPLLTIRGSFTKSCYRIKEVRVMTFTTPNSMIEVLPIAEEDGSVCRDEQRSFEEKVVIKNAPTGRTLLHIRSLNGQAVNRVLNM